ncbi:MAG: MFS transporter [Propionibacteriaceae bacterium]
MTGRGQGGRGGNCSTARASPPLLLAVVAIILIALNLRIPTTSLGPLLPNLLADTGHGETFLSLLTTIPLALTLVVAPLAPRLASRFGRDRVVGCALIGIVAGTMLRSVPGDPTLLAGTAVLGCAIALGTVLTPAVIAAAPPGRRGTLTGMYTMALSLGPALALGLTVPIMRGIGLGWRETLVLWAGCGVLGLGVWGLRSRSVRTAEGAPSRRGRARPEDPPGARSGSAIRDSGVWMLAIYFGITSLTFYTTSTWLPTIFTADGMDAGAAGGYTSLINLVAIPFALLSPIGLRRGLARVLAPLSPLTALAGVLLLITVGADAALVVALLLGVGQGLCLGVSYGQIVEYTRSPEHTASVAAVTSAVGVALASSGPLLFGFGLEASDSHLLPVGGLGAVILVQAVVGIRTGRRTVEARS